jgi:hypothetical protein
MSYTPPSFRGSAFNCSHCGAYAQQTWQGRDWRLNVGGNSVIHTSICARCFKAAVWVMETMVYPDSTNALLVGSETEILQLPSRTPLEPRCRKVA